MGEEKMADERSPDVGKKKPPAKKKRVLAEGDLMKAMIRSGNESGFPKEGDLVVFHCTTYTEEGVIIESTRPEHGGSGSPLKLVLGKSKMIIGWEEALPSMSKGEVARFKVKPALHYGDPECPVPLPEKVPTNGDLLFDVELTDFFKVKVVTDDFGVLKQVMKDGVGWETPREPYEVIARIVGRLAGSNSPFLVRREEPLHFTFGKQELPDGLEKGIGTMTKGEKAIVYISGSYISKGSAIPELPGQASEIQFEVELLQLIQVRDMLGNGCVMKRRVQDGQGEFPVDCPLHDSTLRIHYKGMLANDGDKVFYDTRRDIVGGDIPFEFNSGEGMVPEGLEMCVRLMLPGEVSVVTSTAMYAYDNFSRPPLVPEGASVKWEVELLTFDKRKDWTGFTFKEIMDDAEKQKSTGNRLFKEGKFELAKAKYEFVLREFKHVNPNGDKEASELSQAQDEMTVVGTGRRLPPVHHRYEDLRQISLQLNVAACYQKLGDYIKSIETCNKVLEGNPHHVKALYRRGLAFTATADFEEARTDFNQMILLDKSSASDANAAIMKLKKKEQEAALKARKQFKGLFDKQPGLLSQPEKEDLLPDSPLNVQKEDVKEEEKAVEENEDSADGDDPFASSRRAVTSKSFFRAGLSNIKRMTLQTCSIL